MARIVRSEIRWADLNPVRGRKQAGLRPVLILSHIERIGKVIGSASPEEIAQIVEGLNESSVVSLHPQYPS
jgi:mRNA-degrading endonuclease toxin of MazEF toxin-antitoxin module